MRVVCPVFALLLFGTGIASAFPIGEDLKRVRCAFGNGGSFKSAEEYIIFLKHEKYDEYKYFDRNCNGRLDQAESKELASYVAAQQADLEAGARYEFERARKYGTGVAVPKLPPPPPAPVYGGWSSQLILRDSFEDIGIFTGPKKKSLATGAGFSYARDNEASNTTWSAKGVVAYPFSWQAPPLESGVHPDGVPYLVGLAVTPSVTFQKVSNSSAAVAQKKDVDVLTANIGGEIAVQNLLPDDTTNYFRTRAGVVTNFSGDTRSWNVVSEWQPLTHWKGVPNLSVPHSVFGTPLQYQLDFILRTHYARKIDNDLDDPLFDRGNSAFRLGPVLAFSLAPVQDDLSLPDWFKRITFTSSYSSLENVRTHQTYNLFNTALSYALDKDQTVGLKLSYERGKIEETGQDVSTTKVGLSGKF